MRANTKATAPDKHMHIHTFVHMHIHTFVHMRECTHAHTHTHTRTHTQHTHTTLTCTGSAAQQLPLLGISDPRGLRGAGGNAAAAAVATATGMWFSQNRHGCRESMLVVRDVCVCVCVCHVCVFMLLQVWTLLTTRRMCVCVCACVRPYFISICVDIAGNTRSSLCVKNHQFFASQLYDHLLRQSLFS